MIGLLKKDLYVADRSGRLLLVLALLFSLVPNFGSLGSTYAMMLAFMMPINSIAYDERCKWDRYAAMLPYRTSQIVWSKYLLSYIFALFAEVIILLGMAIRNFCSRGSTPWEETMQISLMLILVMALITAIGFPAIYRFGSEKGRIVTFLLLAAGVGIGVGWIKVADLAFLVSLPIPLLAAAFVLFTVAATAVSFRLSVRFYRNRQNGLYN